MNETFFKLLAYSNKLKENKKFFIKEDPKSFDIFLNFLVIIERNFHYLEKEEYVKLAKDFLDGRINANDFSYSFISIYEGITRKVAKLTKDESLELTNFLKPDRLELGNLLARIYGSCDSFSSGPEVEITITMSKEQELKDYAKILLLKFQKD